jgi:hypothetical protein
MKRSFCVAFGCLCVALLLPTLAPARAEEILIAGGAIHTGVAEAPVQALVVRDGRIAFLGTLEEAKAEAPDAQFIDLKGAFAYPGFVDSHAHLMGIGMRELTLNLDQVRSLKELQEALAAYAAKRAGPITGRGWIETHWPEKRMPTRADIDVVVANRPVFLRRADGHAAIANTKALELGEITNETPDPPGGRIERDKGGEATGMLIDAAMALVEAKLPAPTPALKREALKRGVARVAAQGWTGIHNMSVSGEEVEMLEAMATAKAVPIRVDVYLNLEDAERVLTSGPYEDASGRIRVRGIKLYADGALGSRGAALLEPYNDAPKGSGLILMPGEEMLKHLSRAKKAGAQVAVHAIGDRANRLVLDVFRDAFGTNGGAALRWRIEHAQVIAPADLPRFAGLGIIASMQPSHAISDLHFAPARLGAERLKGAYAWGSLLDLGATIAGGSDAPVEKGEALEEFYAAIHRHDRAGFAGKDWHLEEAVTRRQALAMFTSAPAFAVFREEDLGTLAVGKRADLSVFSVDLMTANPAAIIAARPTMTIVDGKVVFAH